MLNFDDDVDTNADVKCEQSMRSLPPVSMKNTSWKNIFSWSGASFTCDVKKIQNVTHKNGAVDGMLVEAFKNPFCKQRSVRPCFRL